MAFSRVYIVCCIPEQFLHLGLNRRRKLLIYILYIYIGIYITCPLIPFIIFIMRLLSFLAAALAGGKFYIFPPLEQG